MPGRRRQLICLCFLFGAVPVWSPFSWIELPLLRRELLEASQKRRTYALRTLIAVIHVVGFLRYYFSVYSRRGSIRQFSGEGVDAVSIQIMIDIFAIVLLLPAMACSAISGEREKQTLGLLLISRIRPFALVIEKLLSRLLPMTTLLLITVPMLGVAFLLGGVELGDVLLILCLLLTAAIQVGAAAILCSSIFHSAVDAFWGTYALLAAMYFVPGMIIEAAGVPNFALLQTLPADQWHFLCMPYVHRLADSAAGTAARLVLAPRTLPVSASPIDCLHSNRFSGCLARIPFNAAGQLAVARSTAAHDPVSSMVVVAGSDWNNTPGRRSLSDHRYWCAADGADDDRCCGMPHVCRRTIPRDARHSAHNAHSQSRIAESEIVRSEPHPLVHSRGRTRHNQPADLRNNGTCREIRRSVAAAANSRTTGC